MFGIMNIVMSKYKTFGGNEMAKDAIEKLFDIAIKRLRKLGCPESIVLSFERERQSILEKAWQTRIDSGNIPFVFVIPIKYLGLNGMMGMIRYKGKKGKTSLDPSKIGDIIETPETPYCIFNVNNGSATIGQTFEESESFIKGRGRRGLTAIETISLLIQENIPSHSLVSLMSLWDFDPSEEDLFKNVTCVFIDLDKIPTLFYMWKKTNIEEREEVGEKHGCPSCKV